MQRDTLKELSRTCVAEIEEIAKLFDQQTTRCLDVPLARKRMAELKANWKERIRQNKKLEVRRVLIGALSEIQVKANSVPDARWLLCLYGARTKFSEYLS